MKRSKKLFLLIAALFFIMLIAIGFDISRKTTFPGSKEESATSDPSDTIPNTDNQDTLHIEQEN